MRVFVYEWTCCVPDAPPSLCREGWAMLWAALRDCELTGRVETVTLVHESFPHVPPGEVCRIASGNEEECFSDLAASAEATLVIAPECSGILDARCRWVERSGSRLLGPDPRARTVAASKQRLGKLWEKCGVPTPPVLATGKDICSLHEFPLVLKPDDGAGSQAMYLVQNAGQLQQAWRQANLEGHENKLLAQAFVPGMAASIAFLTGPKGGIPLVPAAQHLSEDGRFHYLGGTLPLPSPLEKRATALGRRAVQACNGLCGYIGVDLVLGDAEDGSEDYAIEINPRLTTSYIGLRMLAHDNLALAMLQVALGEDIAELRWRPDGVRFYADGSLETSSSLR
jgi:tyramine---L-glutamate ligase